MRRVHLIFIISLLLGGCEQDDNKEKELELRERELALREKELALKEKDVNTSIQKESQTSKLSATDEFIEGRNKTPAPDKECDSKRQLTGKLIGVYNFGIPCAYPYLKIINDEGKVMSIFLEGDSDNFKINNQAFFKWNDSKVSDYLEKNPLSSGEFPDDTIDVSFFDKKYLFCCYKQQLNCDDDPDSPKVYFCKKISLPY